MKFTSTIVFALAAIVAATPFERSAPFGLISIHSGEINVHLKSVTVDSQGRVALDEGSPLHATINSEGQIQVGNKYFGVGGGSVVKLVSDQGQAVKVFSFDEGHLTLNGDQTWSAIPIGDSWFVAYAAVTEAAVGIALRST